MERRYGWEVVYGANGLRMPFSRKMIVSCSLKDRDSCEYCFGKGTRDEGRPYVPYFKINGDMKISHYDITAYEDVLEFVKESSIRSSEVLPSHQFNAMPPCWFEDPDVLDVVVKKDNKKRRQLTEGYNAVESSLQDKMILPQSDIEKLIY